MGRTFVNAPNIRESAFDERQRQRRNDAIQRSLPAIGMLSALCLVYAMLAGTLGPAWFNATVVQAMLWAIFLLCVSLPSAIIAWTEPDPQALDEPFAANDAS
jgi:DMSO/TMAO reductase YedYZ heme-binding membrane subunit